MGKLIRTSIHIVLRLDPSSGRTYTASMKEDVRWVQRFSNFDRASNLEELPLPYHFDVKASPTIRSPALKEHNDRVGVTIYGKDADWAAENKAHLYRP